MQSLRTIISCLFFISVFLTACETATNDYQCQCTFTVGTMSGEESYDITSASEIEAQAECDEYEEDLGGNAQCELQ